MSSTIVASDKASEKVATLRRLQRGSHAVTALIFLTLISGAFVAGLDAGLTYKSWPKLADRWIPSDLLAYSLTWSNISENPTTVQFNHRILGKLTVASVAALWLMCRAALLPPTAKLASNCLLAMAFVQMGLGITTLLTQVHTHIAHSVHISGRVYHSLLIVTLADAYSKENSQMR